jgi:hypothetical protein
MPLILQLSFIVSFLIYQVKLRRFGRRPNSLSLTRGYSRQWQMGWRTGPPAYVTLCQSRLYPPVRDYEFGNRSQMKRGGGGEKMFGVCTCGDDGILTVDL